LYINDKIRLKKVEINILLIQEHLESMQRDPYGLEFAAWHKEVDTIWKYIFKQINQMKLDVQKNALEYIREPWTSYASHYVFSR
tara:strand:+ start:152 stop:403 length:252 start_codon:yes stop_codon:yes gene_type:complete